jgi:hypothetical protein
MGCEVMNCMQLTQVKVQWLTFVNTVKILERRKIFRPAEKLSVYQGVRESISYHLLSLAVLLLIPTHTTAKNGSINVLSV